MMTDSFETKVDRKQIGIRFLYTLLYLVIFELLKTIVQVLVVFQFIYLLITGKYSNPVRSFSNKVSSYAYRVMRFMTLNENKRPFPFTDFPEEMEPAEEQVSFD